MKLLFINPPNKKLRNEVNKAVLPLGLAYLAAVLLREKYDVRILDSVIEDIDNHFIFNDCEYYGLGIEYIRDEIQKYNPDVVGVSCLFTSTTEISIEICRVSQECNVRHTIIGGPTPSALTEFFISKSCIDLVFIGESEESIAEFSHAVNQGGELDFSKIDGIAYKDTHNHPVIKPKRSFIANIDDIPLPARHLLPMEKYFEISSPQGGVYKSKRNTPILTSRGCPATCCFCASANVWGKGYRMRSPEMVIKEIELLKKEYNIEEFQIQDDNFTLNKKRTIQICKDLKNMDLYWSMPNGVALWALDEEVIKAMGEAGCHFIIAAIESGNKRVLKEVIKKPLKLDTVIDLCKCIKKNRIFLSGFFIVGFPDETLDEIRDTFKFALKCNLDIAGFSYATPLPSTQLWEQAERENLFTNKFDFTHLTYDKPSLKSNNWTIEELEALVISLSRRFYLKTFFKRPKIILFRIIDSFKRDPLTLLRIIYYRTMRR